MISRTSVTAWPPLLSFWRTDHVRSGAATAAPEARRNDFRANALLVASPFPGCPITAPALKVLEQTPAERPWFLLHLPGDARQAARCIPETQGEAHQDLVRAQHDSAGRAATPRQFSQAPDQFYGVRREILIIRVQNTSNSRSLLPWRAAHRENVGALNTDLRTGSLASVRSPVQGWPELPR